MVYANKIIEDLTDREYDVLCSMSQGMSNAEIASQLNLSPATVKWYTRQIYSKLQLDAHDDKRRAATEIARRAGVGAGQTQGVTAGLPADITPFIGRANDLVSLSEMLRAPYPRLLTVVGFGGSGKTRLVLQAARCVHEAYDRHVYFVSLKAVNNLDDLLYTIAHVVGCPLTAKRDHVQSISLHLNTQRTLLILDNAEHLLKVTPIFITLLERIPDLKILVTSRQRLALANEQIYHLNGFRYPVEDTDCDLLSYDAVEYFVHVARSTNPRWEPTLDDLSQIVLVCQLVDGLPLALQLAARQTARMSLSDIVQEIATGNTILASNAPDLPESQRSIETMLEAIYRALTDTQRGIFTALGLFIGDFSREAARDVAGLTDTSIDLFVQRGILETVEPGRFSLHPLVQRYALKRLQNSAAYAHKMHNFIQYYATFAADLGVQLVSGGMIDILEREWSHIQRAWQYGVDDADWSNLHRMLTPIHFFTWRRSYFYTGVALFQKMLDRVNGDTEQSDFALELYMRFLHLRSFFQPLSELELDRLKQTVNLLSDLDACQAYAFGLAQLATIYRGQGQLLLSYEQSEKSFSVYQNSRDEWGMAITAYQMGVIKSLLGDIESAREKWQYSSQLNQSINDRMLASMLLFRLAQIEWVKGRSDIALKFLNDAHHQVTLLRDRDMIASIANLASSIYFSQGDFESTRQQREVSLEYYLWIKQDDVVCYLNTQPFYEALLHEDIATASAIMADLKQLHTVDTSYFVDTCWDHLQFSKNRTVPELDLLMRRVDWMQQVGAPLQSLLTATLALGAFVNGHQLERAVRLGSELSQIAFCPKWLMDLPIVTLSLDSAKCRLGTLTFTRIWDSASKVSYTQLPELTKG